MLRSAFSRVAPVLPRVQATLGQRAYSGIQAFDDRERAAESIYFKKVLMQCGVETDDTIGNLPVGEMGYAEMSDAWEEERVLRKLLKRVQMEAEQHDAEGAKEASKEALHKIVGKYNLSEADKAALEEWKQSH
ncbi:hypothetical protein H632_c947p1 [Helicosporidium sp. ATCC 50920]|nr:hypothetical protein H632_c947p1 [Helicosporidium sp. ATCC 50920]|eukprot:KDD74981.1 hypothetical protein H632_c947p1 [Helicosporidium sp. ATCC 50920]